MKRIYDTWTCKALQTYLPLEAATRIAVNTRTIEATKVVPKETLIRYSAADCQKVSRIVDKRKMKTLSLDCQDI